jgi:hypothetical protein
MSEQDDVRGAIDKYVRAVASRDVGLLRSVFRADAHMWGYLGETLLSIPIEGFFTVVAGSPEPAAWAGGYSHKIRSIEVTGDVAVGVLEEAGYIGADFTNYFSLVRENGSWAIAGKTFFLTGGTVPPLPPM